MIDDKYPTFDQLVEESKHLPEFTQEDADRMAPHLVKFLREC